MAKKSNKIGFTEILTICFIHLKLSNNIDWSWFWIVSPIWIRIIIKSCINVYNKKPDKQKIKEKKTFQDRIEEKMKSNNNKG